MTIPHAPHPDTVAVLMNGAIRVADSLRVSGRFQLVQPLPRSDWVERWGIPAALLVLFGWFINWRLQYTQHELNQKLEDYKLGRDMFLAVFTQRSGALSEVQLNATREIWEKLTQVHWDTINLTSPIRPADPSILRMTGAELRETMAQRDEEEVQRIVGANAELWNALQRERPFLPQEVFSEIDGYCLAIRETLQAVELQVQEQFPDEYSAEAREARVRRNIAYREQRDALREHLGRRYGTVAEAIWKLATPTMPQVEPLTHRQARRG